MALYYEEGLYLFRIDKQGWVETKERKLPMLVFNGDPVARIFKHEDGTEVEEPVVRDSHYDRRIQMVIDGSNDTSLEYAMRKLRFAGFNGESFADLDLTGRTVRARCTHGEYNNKPNEQWDFALPDGGATTKALDSGLTRKLDALFGKRLKEGAKPKAAPAARQPVVPAKESHRAAVDAQAPYEPAAGGDEVPF